MKSADTERVLEPVSTVVATEDSADGCVSKTAGKSVLFLCLVLSGDCDEL